MRENKYTYLIGFSLAEINSELYKTLTETDIENILNKSKWKWKKTKVEEALNNHIPECLDKKYKNPSSMQSDAPNFFSCSSLISYLYVQAGVWMPSLSIDKYVYASPISKGEAKFGDLVFSNTGEGMIRTKTVEYKSGTEVPEGVDHVAMYLGDEKILHATKKSGKVVIQNINDAEGMKNIIGIGRVADISEKRYVISVPDNRPDLRNRINLIYEIKSKAA